jgi:hypothetical protein
MTPQELDLEEIFENMKEFPEEYSEFAREDIASLVAEVKRLRSLCLDRVTEVGELQSALEEIERLKNQWQPIETAPKDGTPVLLYIPDGHRDRDQRWVGMFKADCWRSLNYSPLSYRPTHWMPLPAAPVTSQAQEDGE